MRASSRATASCWRATARSGAARCASASASAKESTRSSAASAGALALAALDASANTTTPADRYRMPAGYAAKLNGGLTELAEKRLEAGVQEGASAAGGDERTHADRLDVDRGSRARWLGLAGRVEEVPGKPRADRHRADAEREIPGRAVRVGGAPGVGRVRMRAPPRAVDRVHRVAHTVEAVRD